MFLKDIKSFVTFDQFNLSMLSKSINFLQKIPFIESPNAVLYCEIRTFTCIRVSALRKIIQHKQTRINIIIKVSPE